MRELIGKIPTPDPNVTEEVSYCDEGPVDCSHDQQTIPAGEKYIEVIAYETQGEFKKERLRLRYCRTHGAEYERKARNAS